MVMYCNSLRAALCKLWLCLELKFLWCVPEGSRVIDSAETTPFKSNFIS